MVLANVGSFLAKSAFFLMVTVTGIDRIESTVDSEFSG